jgi:triacylglycerol lipase
MAKTRALLVAVSVALLASALPAAAAAPGPPLRVPGPDLARALQCPATFSHPDHNPVLLVHGTNLTADEGWGWNYGMVLPQLGFDTCLVTIPGRERGDIQVSSEYVVAAVRTIHSITHRRVDLIGHSQGAVEPRWAMRWWPDITRDVDRYISLAGAHHGIYATDGLCASGSCYPAAWQTRHGADFLAALNRGSERIRGVAMTSIYSETDDVVQPYQTSMLDGAANIAVQQLCPGRPVDHIGMVYDSVVFQLVIDALTHRGPAVAARAGVDCAQVVMPRVTPVDIAAGESRLYGNTALYSATATDNVGSEPPVQPYAR